jgi:signal transduction histidine kinase/nucleoside 2-deoxyribosyltransferase
MADADIRISQRGDPVLRQMSTPANQQSEGDAPLDGLRQRCFLTVGNSPAYQKAREALYEGAERAGFQAFWFDDFVPGMLVPEALTGEIARADCVLAEISDDRPNVFYEVGIAWAMGKGIFLFVREDRFRPPAPGLLGHQVIIYRGDPLGLEELTNNVSNLLQRYSRAPQRQRTYPAAWLAAPFFVDWDRLEMADSENLCRELLMQMGYRSLDWVRGQLGVDLVAELPKKDPDGFEYREVWLVSMGRSVPPEMMLNEVNAGSPERFISKLRSMGVRTEGQSPREGINPPITVLIIVLREAGAYPEDLRELLEAQVRKNPRSARIRVRIWDRRHLTELVQSFPQIGYKYFSDEARSSSQYRKTLEEYYSENVELTDRLRFANAALEEEKDRRIRAERDAVWKDISFAAAHKLGNPIFAIETYLEPLRRRVRENRVEDAEQVIAGMGASVEKAKEIVDQFKSLSRAQTLSIVPTLLRPMLEDLCVTVREWGVECGVQCPPDLQVPADPDRIAGCFDGLAVNSKHWFDKPIRTIEIEVINANPALLPSGLDSARPYVVIRFKDNGAGVPLADKDRIFDAFVTKRDQGTGLGLALVRRVVEGHGGAIYECGIPGEGAEFYVFLPLAHPEKNGAATSNGAADKGDHVAEA